MILKAYIAGNELASDRGLQITKRLPRKVQTDRKLDKEIELGQLTCDVSGKRIFLSNFRIVMHKPIHIWVGWGGGEGGGSLVNFSK